VTIVKQTSPSTAGQSFPFAADVTGTTPANNLTDFGNPGGTFSLAGAGAGSSQTFSVHPGTYTVTEGATAGWAPAGLSCTGDANSSGDPATSVSTLDLSPGDSVTCTYQNVKLATLSVTKTEGGWRPLDRAERARVPAGGVVIGRLVELQPQVRHDARRALVGDVDDPSGADRVRVAATHRGVVLVERAARTGGRAR
jgi:hypothetical protein